MSRMSLVFMLSLTVMGSEMSAWVPTPTDVQIWTENTKHYHQQAIQHMDDEYMHSVRDHNNRTRLFACKDGFKSICTMEFSKRAPAVPQMIKEGLMELEFDLQGIFVHGYIQELSRYMVCMHVL